MQTTELDLGPLTWVKSEIDLALARADDSLTKARASSEAPTHVQFAQTHLHQACGALSIVGLDGVTQFATSLDRLLGAMARGEQAVDDAALNIAGRAIAAIGNYLEELVRGTHDQPMRLSPLYAEIAAAQGITDASPVDLFYPDLSRRPALRRGTHTITQPDWMDQLRRTRAKFERGLLLWLKNAADASGPAGMREACLEIEEMLDSPAAATLWWSAQAFFDVLAHADQPDVVQARKLCTQLAKELRQLEPGSGAAPDTLMREMLFCIAQSPVRTARQQAVHEVWQLSALIPDPGSKVTEIPLAPLLKVLHAELATGKRAWDEFCVGQASALPRFSTHLTELTRNARQLGRPAVDRLLAGICDFTAWLRKDPLQFQDAIAIEVATALLLAEISLDRGVPETGFAAQVDDTLNRLNALSRGEIVPSPEGSATVSTARKLHEKQARLQVSREILSNLAQVEQALDDFFRNQEKRAPLTGLAIPLKQIEGALALIGEEQAISLVRESAQTVARLAGGNDKPASGEFETLAQRLSALGFYVAALQHGPADLNQYLHPEASATGIEIETAAPAESVSAAQPEAAHDAPAHAAAPALESGFETALEVDEIEELEPLHLDFADPAPIPAEAPLAATSQAPATDSDTDAIDAELLEIFLEEADEVLSTIENELTALHPGDTGLEPLTSIRRAFHTLKGSGRMVGLTELGEAAWGIEQTLNRWLQLDWMPTPELIDLIASAHGSFARWAAQIAAGQGHSYDIAALMSDAQRLREEDTAVAANAPTDSETAGLDETVSEEVATSEYLDTRLDIPAKTPIHQGIETIDLDAIDFEEDDLETMDLEASNLDTMDLEAKDFGTADVVTPDDDDFLSTETSLDAMERMDLSESYPEEHALDTPSEEVDADFLPEETALDEFDLFAETEDRKSVV